jgi:hypothetical protein
MQVRGKGWPSAPALGPRAWRRRAAAAPRRPPGPPRPSAAAASRTRGQWDGFLPQPAYAQHTSRGTHVVTPARLRLCGPGCRSRGAPAACGWLAWGGAAVRAPPSNLSAAHCPFRLPPSCPQGRPGCGYGLTPQQLLQPRSPLSPPPPCRNRPLSACSLPQRPRLFPTPTSTSPSSKRPSR